MSLPTELLFLTVVPVALPLIRLIAHLATLRGLRGSQRITAFQLFVDAARRRR
ncbi:hypothetical protein [Streptomyces acidiscabies]|uniref:hypothetical protein n=1 Tax=Streptomyces acidiscabies TaxID=42234 RepID=UPI0015BE81FA|nr:hypothetical protein [Streptomyces acidiscabies]